MLIENSITVLPCIINSRRIAPFIITEPFLKMYKFPFPPSTFNFSVPELSWLAALLLFGAMLVLHFIPIRALLLIWGIIKFTKRIIRPHVVSNNEVLDFLSRVPDDEELVRFIIVIVNLFFAAVVIFNALAICYNSLTHIDSIPWAVTAATERSYTTWSAWKKETTVERMQREWTGAWLQVHAECSLVAEL